MHLNYTQQAVLFVAYLAFAIHDGVYSIRRTHHFFKLSILNFFRMQRTHFLQIGVVLVYIVIGFPLMLWTRLFPDTIYKNWFYLARAVLFVLGMNIKQEGRLPKDQTFIAVANHTSFLDIFLFAYIFNGKVGTAFLHKKLLSIWVLGWWIKRLDAIPVVPPTAKYESATAGERKQRKTFLEKITASMLPKFKISEEEMKKVNVSAMRKAFKTVKSGLSLIVLPEGTRTLNGKMKKFEEGAFLLAKKAEVSIVPVAFIGSYEAKPKNRQWIRPTTIIIRIGEPINGETLSPKEFAEQAQQAVGVLLHQPI